MLGYGISGHSENVLAENMVYPLPCLSCSACQCGAWAPPGPRLHSAHTHRAHALHDAIASTTGSNHTTLCPLESTKLLADNPCRFRNFYFFFLVPSVIMKARSAALLTPVSGAGQPPLFRRSLRFPATTLAAMKIEVLRYTIFFLGGTYFVKKTGGSLAPKTRRNIQHAIHFCFYNNLPEWISTTRSKTLFHCGALSL